MISIISHIYKENLLLLKNRISYILILVIPILAIMVNIFMSQSSSTILNIAIIGEDVIDIIDTYNSDEANIKLEYLEFNDMKSAYAEFEEDKISLIIGKDNQNNITLHYSSSNQGSIYAYQIVNSILQTYISQALVRDYPIDVAELQSKQIYRINQPVNINLESNATSETNYMIFFSLMWIIAMMSLNLSINQMQQEKAGNTLYAIIKLPTSRAIIILAKQTAVIVQCFLATLFLTIFINVSGVDNIFYIFRYSGWIILSICSISMFGYCLGLLINNYSVVPVIILFISIPSMLASSISVSSNIVNIIKFIPTYCVCNILKNILDKKDLGLDNILLLSINAFIFFVLSLIIINKREPVKLCKNI